MTSRRRFLQIATGAGLGLAGCQSAKTTSNAAPPDQANAGEAKAPAIPPERVVVARDPSAVHGTEIDAAEVAALLDRAMAALTPANHPAAAWRALFRPSDTVAIKVNCLSGPPLSSHPEVAAAVAQSLRTHVGTPANSIIAYDRLREELQIAGFDRSPDSGYQCQGTDEVGYDAEPTTINQAGSCYSRVISERATAIINVPVLKDHDLAGLTGALKNHFGSIHNPNKMHMDHCTPYIADVNCAPCIRDKHRLVVYDALLVCYDGGPGYNIPDATTAYGALMVAVDPVAADAVAFSLLEQLRREHGLPPIAGSEREPKYIQVAADEQHSLGVADLERIDLVEVS
jgi:uncharacterized protein (DUF362 family)